MMVTFNVFLSVVRCYDDDECTILLGAIKRSVDQCCQPPDNNGIGASYYSTDTQCLDCASVLGKTYT